jgi:adenylate kinase
VSLADALPWRQLRLGAGHDRGGRPVGHRDDCAAPQPARPPPPCFVNVAAVMVEIGDVGPAGLPAWRWRRSHKDAARATSLFREPCPRSTEWRGPPSRLDAGRLTHARAPGQPGQLEAAAIAHRLAPPPTGNPSVKAEGSSMAGARDDGLREASMRILMIAPPGAGKGTQGALIAAHFNIPHIATGELLRDHVARGTALGQAVKAYLDRGELVPDQIVLDMVREAMIAAKAAGGGYVLDGIPRNMEQARAAYQIGLELGMTADVALHLQADDAELTRRLLARAALEHRSDDTPEVIAQRLALYYEVTAPIVAWYRDRGILVSVDAMRSAHEVGREILVALEAMRPFLEHAPANERLPVDLTSLGEAFGATGPAASSSG